MPKHAQIKQRIKYQSLPLMYCSRSSNTITWTVSLSFNSIWYRLHFIDYICDRYLTTSYDRRSRTRSRVVATQLNSTWHNIKFWAIAQPVNGSRTISDQATLLNRTEPKNMCQSLTICKYKEIIIKYWVHATLNRLSYHIAWND